MVEAVFYESAASELADIIHYGLIQGLSREELLVQAIETLSGYPLESIPSIAATALLLLAEERDHGRDDRPGP